MDIWIGGQVEQWVHIYYVLDTAYVLQDWPQDSHSTDRQWGIDKVTCLSGSISIWTLEWSFSKLLILLYESALWKSSQLCLDEFCSCLCVPIMWLTSILPWHVQCSTQKIQTWSIHWMYLVSRGMATKWRMLSLVNMQDQESLMQGLRAY